MCNCANEIDQKLVERNTRLSRALVFGGHKENPYLMVETEQIETGRGKKKASKMFMSFCPFCGEQYPDDGK